jgi:UDP-GlcNAc:undecaprenyl-phosphate GlcNAc-1-phosphate transferase
MTALLLTFALSFGLCMVLTPAARRLAARWGLTDKPDGHRKLHSQPTPLAGGFAILPAVIGALAAVQWLPNPWDGTIRWKGWEFGLLLASGIICALGFIDDRWGLRAWAKLAGQLAAILVLVQSGLVVQSIQLFGWSVDLGWLAIPLTMLWLLGTINSLNLLDGMDGLLSCLGLVISLAMAVMAALVGHWSAAAVAAALAGALLGFLRYNFPPASVFLGDAGSMLIGLVVGVLAIQSSLKGPAATALAVPVALLTLPFFDTTAAIVRRKLRGLSVSTPDRGHLHHCLLRRGLSNRRILMCVSVFGLVTGTGALASQTLNNELFAILSGLAVVTILVASRLFGHVEMRLIRDRLVAGAESLWQGAVNGKSATVEMSGAGLGEWKELWDTLTARAGQFHLKAIRLDVKQSAAVRKCHARWADPDEPVADSELWRAEIPLHAHGQGVGRLEVVGHRQAEPWRHLATLFQLVEDFEKQHFLATAVAGESTACRVSLPPYRVHSTVAFSD